MGSEGEEEEEEIVAERSEIVAQEINVDNAPYRSDTIFKLSTPVMIISASVLIVWKDQGPKSKYN